MAKSLNVSVGLDLETFKAQLSMLIAALAELESAVDTIANIGAVIEEENAE